MDSGNIFPKIIPIYKEINASKHFTKRRISKSLANIKKANKNISKIIQNAK